MRIGRPILRPSGPLGPSSLRRRLSACGAAPGLPCVARSCRRGCGVGRRASPGSRAPGSVWRTWVPFASTIRPYRDRVSPRACAYAPWWSRALPDVLPRFTSPTVDGYPVTVRPLVVIEPRGNDDYTQYTVHFRLQPVRNQRRQLADARIAG